MSNNVLARIGLCCTLLFAIAACGDQGEGPAGTDAALTVSTVKVAPKPLPLVIETVGRAEGSKAVEVRARVTGILEQQIYSEGAQVKAGELLFRIEAAPFEIALAHARAALAEEQARNLQARRNADRLSGLAKQNAVSRRVADDAVSAVEGSDAALLAAQANVREAQLNLSYTKVVAPIGGITGRAMRSEGSLLTAGADSSLLTTLTQADPMWVRFALSEAEYSALRSANAGGRGESMSVTLLGKDGTARKSAGQSDGKLNFSASTIDESLGTVQLRAEFSNPQLATLPGEYVRVRLTGGAREAITIPQQAVLQNSQGPFVWIVNGEGHAEQRAIKTGAWVGTEWQINEGLQDGDTVIIDNLLKLTQGVQVRQRGDQIEPATLPANAEVDAPPSTPTTNAG